LLAQPELRTAIFGDTLDVLFGRKGAERAA
jgi:hypothetical protein